MMMMLPVTAEGWKVVWLVEVGEQKAGKTPRPCCVDELIYPPFAQYLSYPQTRSREDGGVEKFEATTKT